MTLRTRALVTVAALSAAAVLPATIQAAPTPGKVVITEFEYQDALEAAGVSGAKYEFFELTNIGGTPVDLTGWSGDDDSRAPGSFSLSGLGTVAPGQSVVVTEATAANFRAKWGLGSTAPATVVLGGWNQGLGNGDEINVYDATGALVDRLTYTSALRTQGKTGVPDTDAALGANDATKWRFSTVGDTDGSWAAPNGADPGSPGVFVSRSGDPGSGGDTGGGTFTPDPNWARVRINEVSSDNDPPPIRDTVELTNTGDVAVDITGWLQGDSGGPSSATDFSGRVHLPDGTLTTSIPAHGFVWFQSLPSLSSSGDAVHIYLPDGAAGAAGTEVDGVSFGAGGAGTEDPASFGAAALARCPDGTGVFVPVAARSFGASNAPACEHQVVNPGEPAPNDLPAPCAPEAPSGSDRFLPADPSPWPGGSDVSTADALCSFETATGPEGRDVSGLVFSKAEPGVLWAVKNKNWLFKLVKQGGLYVAAPGWAGGKEIRFPGGTGQPDSEGITEGPDGLLYVTTERDNAAKTIALNSILQIDPNTSAGTLTATKQWDLTSEFPWLQTGSSTEANLGFEGITYVPDTYLTQNGFVDQRTGATYNPADYPGHGSGLFFAALEDNGNLYAYALAGNGSFTRVAVVPTGLSTVQDVAYDADLERVWALCDNSCGVTSTLLAIGPTGALAPEKVFARPAGLPNNNLEGFAVAPVATSTDGRTREVVWSDDGIYGTGVGSATEGHAIYRGSIDLDLGLGAQGVPTAGVSSAVVPAGTQVTVTGSGFAPGETVRIVLRSTNVTLGTAVPGANGRISTPVTIPAGTVLGATTIALTGQSSGRTASAPLTVVAPPPSAWSATTVYNTGDRVTYGGRTFQALWYTRGEAPGKVNGAWSEYATDAAGNRLWTPSGVFTGGDVVLHNGTRWVAQWYSRGETPGSSPYVSWKVVVDNAHPAPWVANSVYLAGDRVTYQGRTYQAQWYTANQVPTTPYGPWKRID